MKPVLSAKNIQKTFQRPQKVEVLKDISFDLYPGQSVAIMGASGEGKSTLLHILGTLEEPTRGELFITGKSVAQHPPSYLRNQHIGFVFQAFNLLEDYTVVQNILMPALIGNKPIHKGSSSYLRALELLEKVGLSHRLHFAARFLSGGEKQRVALARALCNDPEIILADEPSGNLDHETSESIHKLLLDSTKKMNKSLVIVTHDQELARLCDQILHLCDGVLIK
ncbi:MAG: ABC transporter ATP-binding protein [Chlamydiales bacterium]